MKKLQSAAVGALALALLFGFAAPARAIVEDLPNDDGTTYSPTIVTQPTVQPVSTSNSSGVSADVSSCSNLASTGIKGIVSCIIGFFNYFVYLIMSLSVVYVIYGAFQMIQSEEKREQGKATVMYGIIGLFVMISIWGFVNILDNTFKLSGQAPKSPPALFQKK